MGSSGRQWFLKLHTFLLHIGFRPSTADPCIYIRNTHGKLIILSVYVDDLALFSPNPETISEVQALLMARFSMKDLGEFRTYLGLHMVSDSESFTVHVAPYIAQLVAQYIPEPNIRLPVLLSPEPTSDVPSGSLVGSLSYIAVVARPDIARAVLSL